MGSGLYVSQDTLDAVHVVIERRSNNLQKATSLVLREDEPIDTVLSWFDVIERAAVMDRRTFQEAFILQAAAQAAAALESFCFYNIIR